MEIEYEIKDDTPLWQVKMLVRGNLPGLCPVSLLYREGSPILKYNIQNTVSLNDWLQMEKPTSFQLLTLTKQLALKTQRLEKEYFLSLKHVDFYPEDLFIRKEDKEMLFIYLPGAHTATFTYLLTYLFGEKFLGKEDKTIQDGLRVLEETIIEENLKNMEIDKQKEEKKVQSMKIRKLDYKEVAEKILTSPKYVCIYYFLIFLGGLLTAMIR